MCDCVATELTVQTCPQCLPIGAITWLIENGRQLDMWEIIPQVDSDVSVSALEAEAELASNQKITESPEWGLPF